MKHEIKEFNNYFRVNCWSKAPNVAELFHDAGARDWARLASTWYSRFQFGNTAPDSDEWHDGQKFRRKSVDRLVAEPEFDPAGDVLFFAWVHWKKTHVSVTKITLSDAPPASDPKPSSDVAIQKPGQSADSAKKSVSWRGWAGVAASVLGAIAVAVKLIVPGWIVLLLDIVVKILNAISGGG